MANNSCVRVLIIVTAAHIGKLSTITLRIICVILINTSVPGWFRRHVPTVIIKLIHHNFVPLEIFIAEITRL